MSGVRDKNQKRCICDSFKYPALLAQGCLFIAFAFGAPESLLGNIFIASWAVRRAHELKIPIVTQKDIRIAVKNVELYYIESDHYLSSLGIIHGLQNLALSKGRKRFWKKVLVIAAPQHIWRCARDLKKEGFDVVIDREFLKTYDRKKFYNIESNHLWTCLWLFWWPRELPLRLLPYYIYRRLAK